LAEIIYKQLHWYITDLQNSFKSFSFK
jgi:hypothetical protein